MELGTEVGLGPGHIVLDGEPVSLPQKGDRVPQFSAHFYCGQTAVCIKMPLGMEIALGSGHIMLDRDPAPRKMGSASPNFRRKSIVVKQLDGSRWHLA